MGTFLLGLLLVVNVVLLALVFRLFQRHSAASQADVKMELAAQAENLENALTQRFTSATADMAMRLEQTKGTYANRCRPAGRGVLPHAQRGR